MSSVNPGIRDICFTRTNDELLCSIEIFSRKKTLMSWRRYFLKGIITKDLLTRFGEHEVYLDKCIKEALGLYPIVLLDIL